MPTIISGTNGVDNVDGVTFEGATVSPQRIQTFTAQASTAGTSIDFTGIPTWAKEITVMFNGVSTNGASVVQVQLGTLGGVVTSGYTGVADSQSTGGGSTTSFTTGIGLERTGVTSAASVRGGALVISNISGTNSWMLNYQGYFLVSGTFTSWGSSVVTLPAILDRIRITTVNGTDTFDAGSINILVKG